MHFKCKVHVLIEFIDPCDRVTKLAFYENNHPFAGHDFSKDIPNPKTREHALSYPNYKKYTLKDYGLHRQIKRQ